MGLFDGVKGTLTGTKAYRTHVAANKLMDQGRPAEARQKFMQALALYDEANRLGGADLTVQRAYGVLLMREGRFQDAHDVMVKVSKRKDLKEQDWFNLRVQFSLYLWKTGQLDKAIETINRAAAIQTNGMIYSTLGMYLVDKARQTGDFAEALAYNEQALDYDDEDGSVLDNMGQLYEAMSEAAEGEQAEEYRAKALDFYEKAHKAKPRQITTLYYLARMYHRNGDNARARELLANRDKLYISAVCPVRPDMMEALAAEIG